jgi:hypothetical protein
MEKLKKNLKLFKYLIFEPKDEEAENIINTLNNNHSFLEFFGIKSFFQKPIGKKPDCFTHDGLITLIVTKRKLSEDQKKHLSECDECDKEYIKLLEENKRFENSPIQDMFSHIELGKQTV